MLQKITHEYSFSKIAINDFLNESISTLAVEVKSLSELHINLTGTISDLERQNSNYTELLKDLERSNNQTINQIKRFEIELTNLGKQNEEFSKNNDHLVSILTFMNQTSIDLNTTINEITGYLGREIDENSVLVLLSLEHSYQNVYIYWTIAGLFDDLFENKSWMEDRDKSIGKDDYEELMEYIDEYVISEVCANRTDFENFLANDRIIGYSGAAPPVNISFRSIRSGVERYFSSMMDYYFSYRSTGISKIEWITAEFDCKNIAVERRFTWN